MPSTHADAIREAERAVVEAAVDMHEAHKHMSKTFRQLRLYEHANASLLGSVDDLIALRERTCPVCKGTGMLDQFAPVPVTTGPGSPRTRYPHRLVACVCDSGAIRSTEDTRAKGGAL